MQKNTLAIDRHLKQAKHVCTALDTSIFFILQGGTRRRRRSSSRRSPGVRRRQVQDAPLQVLSTGPLQRGRQLPLHPPQGRRRWTPRGARGAPPWGTRLRLAPRREAEGGNTRLVVTREDSGGFGQLGLEFQSKWPLQCRVTLTPPARPSVRRSLARLIFDVPKSNHEPTMPKIIYDAFQGPTLTEVGCVLPLTRNSCRRNLGTKYTFCYSSQQIILIRLLFLERSGSFR